MSEHARRKAAHPATTASSDASKAKGMEAAQAEALEALGNVDVTGLVRLIEQDAKCGIMDHGQRKSAHLLLSYYAPKAAPALAKPDDGLHLSSAQILDMLAHVRAIRAGQPSHTGQNTGSVHDLGSNSEPNQSVTASDHPSLPESVLSAGVLSEESVLSDTPQSNTKNGSGSGSATPQSTGESEPKSSAIPDSVAKGML